MTATQNSIDDYRSLREDTAPLDLGSWCVLKLTGSETREFLQGMATQDLAAGGPQQASRSLFLNEKGRPVAQAWVLVEPTGTEAVVIADEGARATLRPHFERFRIMEDVEFEGPEGMPRLIGWAGPHREEGVTQFAAANSASRVVHAEPLSFVLLPETERALPAFAHSEAVEAWRLAIGLPRTGVDFDLDRIATELNLPEAISFTKGCYVGQEVVARTSNRGQVRRRRVGFRFDWPGSTPPAKAEIRSEGAPAGFLTSAAREPGSGEGIGMGYLSVELIERRAPLELIHNGSITLRIRDWTL